MADGYKIAGGILQLLGEKLLSGENEVKTEEALAGKTVLLYFSAHWCPPCRGFTPAFADAYKEYKKSGGNEAEVVFISRDRDISAFKDYFAEMPWLAMPFGEDQMYQLKLQTMMGYFNVEGIPCIKALSPDATEYTYGEGVDLRQLVGQHKAAAFPMTPDHVKKLQAEAEQLKVEALKELKSCVPALRSKSGEETSFANLVDSREHVVFILGDGDGADDNYKKLEQLETDINAKSSGSPRTAFVYLGWSLYNDTCNHAPFKDSFYTLQAGDLTEDLKKKMNAVCEGKVGPPHALVVGRDESGSLTIVRSDQGCRALLTLGCDVYPWSKEAIALAEAAKAKKVADAKEKQANLQFLKAEGRDGLFSNSGTEVKVDSLANGDANGVIGLYFSAHWCPPCRGFTPMLAECYNALKAEGKPFEVVFLSSDKDSDAFNEYFKEMPWLSVPFADRQTKEVLEQVFEVRGIPTLVLLKPNGELLPMQGRECIQVGAAYFPWGPDDMKRGKEAAEKIALERKQKAIEAEKADIQEQTAKGGLVIKRIRGEPGISWSHAVADHKVELKNFPSVGAPDMLAKAGVLYYEVEVLASEGIPQLGFALADWSIIDTRCGDGVGDDDSSWGLDGVRKTRWYKGSASWDCTWQAGDVIGLAANIDLGKIAVSKNGSWTEGANGVVFENEKIKAGVYPALTGSSYNMRYNMDGSSHGPFKHAAPTNDIWAKSAE